MSNMSKTVTLRWGEEAFTERSLARTRDKVAREVEAFLVDRLCDADCGSVTRGRTRWNIAVAVRLVRTY